MVNLLQGKISIFVLMEICYQLRKRLGQALTWTGFRQYDQKMDSYTFSVLSNGRISFKSGIFISIFIPKNTHLLYLAKIVSVKFPKIIVKNATIFVSFFLIRLYTFHEIFLNIDIKIDFLVKNQIV